MNLVLAELYQEIILDHNKAPRNFRSLSDADHKAEGYNPLCGDKVTIYLKMGNDRIEDISFQGVGCAISTASASLMTETLKGKTREEAKVLFQQFRSLVTGRSDADGDMAVAQLGKLAVFEGVSEFPVRVKCATLVWHTFQAALDKSGEAVSTE